MCGFRPLHVATSLCQIQRVLGNGAVVSRSTEARNLCHFVINGDFLGVCVPGPASDVSHCIGFRTLLRTRLGCNGRLQDPAHLAPHVEQSCERRNFSLPCLTSAHSWQQAAICRNATPRLLNNNHTHFTVPTSAMITTLLPCLFSGDCGSHFFFSLLENPGEEQRS